jgi:hypothetical protein
MWVYGDHARRSTAHGCIAALQADAAAIAGYAPGLARHAALVRLFIAAGELAQGLADRASEATGADGPDRDAEVALAAARAAGRAVVASWRSRLAEQPTPALRLDGIADASLTLREGEGYAFYALYPELYLQAAAGVPPGALLVGLRSIGAGLAALVAAASDAAEVVTVRPTGAPFARTIAAAPALEARVRGHRGSVALVDEGPGLSGSSLGGTADWLRGLGVGDDRLFVLPGHAGPLGPEASSAHRAWWAGARTLVVPFERAFLGENAALPLAGWFADVVGPATGPLVDLSGGAWRGATGRDAPVDPNREARKFLLPTADGDVLLRFVGLGAAGEGKWARARALAGFVPKPLALRHGFLAERWEPGPEPARAAVLARLPAYLNARAALPAERGADLPTLLAMARHNAGRDLFGRWSDAEIAALEAAVRPCAVDGRLHRWEWIASRDGVRKADALDHARGHDLIGGQDIAWDVAGACVEWALDAPERAALAAAVLAGRPPALLAVLERCYAAFQLGWWSYAPDSPAVLATRDRYRAALAGF